MPRDPYMNEYIRGLGTLVAIDSPVPPPPPPPPSQYIFQSVTAHVQVRLRSGTVLTRLRTYWDYSGHLSSVDDAIQHAKQYADENGITATSDVEVYVQKNTTCERRTRDPSTNKYSKETYDFIALPHGSRADVPADIEEVVWSTRSRRTGRTR